MSTDLTFITNEPGTSLRDRFGVLLGDDTRYFDCLVGFFFISGFYKLYPALEKVEKIRILVGLQTDRTAYELLQRAKEQGELTLQSHASTKERVSKDVLNELEKSPDSAEIETGVHKFVEWIRSGKLEIKNYPAENLHAKVYIMTFAEGDRDKGRVITGSSNLTESGLQHNLEFNVELKNRSDYEFAIAKFNELWAVAVDVSKPYEDTTVKHPVMAGCETEVQAVLETPGEIRRSKSDANVYLFYRSRRNRRWVCAVSKQEGRTGFLITAYPTDAIKEGEKISLSSR